MNEQNSLIIRPGAEIDIIQAHDWYNLQLSGLGKKFVEEIDKAFERILSNPELYPKSYKNLRKAVVRKFPFCVFYSVVKNNVLVFAVFHAKRNPKSWQVRK